MHIESIPAKPGKRGKYAFFICSTYKNSRGAACGAKRLSLRSIEAAVVEALLTQVLTPETLRPLAREISEAISERSWDTGARLMAVEEKLEEARKSLSNIVDAIECMGYSTHLQQRYDTRKREEEELALEVSWLKKLQVKPAHLTLFTDELLNGWIEHLRKAFEADDRAAARRLLQQFVAKIVIKEKAGTLYYTFPLPDEAYMPSVRNLDLRGYVSSPSQIHAFGVPKSPVTAHRHADQDALCEIILTMHADGLSYRAIGAELGLHWTRVGQILKSG